MTGAARLARAKVNLFLHVGPAEGDGYHPVVSLAAFADVGDRLSVEPAKRLSFRVNGPFASGLEGEDNLVVRALRALAEKAGRADLPLRVALEKRLPVAAGLGGGSSDAGAALRLARDTLKLPMSEAVLARIAADLGADGPMCLAARAAWAEGRGDILTFEPRLPPMPAVLVNPLAPSPTGRVYAAYDAGPTRTADRPANPDDWSVPGMIRWLAQQRNDLERPAIEVQPAIAEALGEASRLDAPLVRMSGSGATVFALFATPEAAGEAAVRLSVRRPDWWVRQTTLS